MSCPLKRFPMKAKCVGSEECNPEKVKELDDLYQKMMAARENFDRSNTFQQPADEPATSASALPVQTKTGADDAFSKMLAERKKQDEVINKFLTEDEYNTINGKGPASNNSK